MSFCRFSTDDCKSDVYVYETGVGYMLHLAGSRFTRNITNKDSISDINKIEREDITLEDAGTTIRVGTLRELKETIEKYEKIGYHVPIVAYERINKELKRYK